MKFITQKISDSDRNKTLLHLKKIGDVCYFGGGQLRRLLFKTFSFLWQEDASTKRF